MPRLLLRLLAGVHLVAFVSLWVQVDGLIGSRGILPAQDFFAYLERVLDAGTPERLANAPSLLWFSSSDPALHLLCTAGVLLSLLAIGGMATAPVFGALWICYLSLVWGGQTFLAFQWDTLLLEATLCAVVLAPMGWPFRGPTDAPADAEPRPIMASVRSAFQVAPNPTAGRPGLWLFRLLAVKLMFLSGAVKLLSLDSTWWQLTALDVHYFTQPLPVTASWYVHHLPDWFHRLSVAIMFAVELVVPWCLFWRRLRRPGVWLLLALQLLIAATGNYGFFNLLTAVLCLSWLDRLPLAGPSRPDNPPAASTAARRPFAGVAGTRIRWLARRGDPAAEPLGHRPRTQPLAAARTGNAGDSGPAGGSRRPGPGRSGGARPARHRAVPLDQRIRPLPRDDDVASRDRGRGRAPTA